MANRNNKSTAQNATDKTNAEQTNMVPTSTVNDLIHELVVDSKIVGKEGVDILDEDGHKKTAGRPIDPESPRQKRLLELEVKRQLKLLRRGRPVDPNSDRQSRLANMEVKRAAGELRPGRPPMSEDEKAKSQAAREKLQKQRASELVALAKEKIKADGLDKEMKSLQNTTPQTQA